MTPQEEAAIMHAARHDIHAFAPLYERYFPRIYAYCLRRCANPQEAEDLTSTIFTRALTALDSYSGGHVAAWLFAIAHNTLVNHYRGRKPLLTFEDALSEGALPEGEGLNPLDEVLQAEERASLLALVRRLPPEQQDLLALKMGGQLSSEQIAAVVGKKPGAVRVELHRILKQLRRMLQGEGV